MGAATPITAHVAISERERLLTGRAFIGPAFDLLVIGGGLSLIALGVILGVRAELGARIPQDLTLPLILLTTSAHFASSTVRLYTKPDAFRTLPAMTMLFPAIALAVTLVALRWPELIGRNLFLLYLSWSPYHYAAQTFGLSSMYSARAGMGLSGNDRRLLWWSCMLPFMHNFVYSNGSGLAWFVPASVFIDQPQLLALRSALIWVTGVGVFAAPALLLGMLRFRTGRMVPVIVPCLLISNGVWWTLLQYESAFLWATIFHGLQYLAIVLVFHLKDHVPEGSPRRMKIGVAVRFYLVSLALGYVLFDVWPWFYAWLGFSFSESVLVCVAVINIHHFVVDRGIWQIRKDVGNQRAVRS